MTVDDCPSLLHYMTDILEMEEPQERVTRGVVSSDLGWMKEDDG